MMSPGYGKHLSRSYLIFLISFFSALAHGEEAPDYEGHIPPGWEYSFTPYSHVISVPLTSNPEINGSPIKTGDLVGVFYYDSITGDEFCGGFEAWNGLSNIAVLAYGDDPTTILKDGFYVGEPFVWKIYSMASSAEYEAIAIYDMSLPQNDGVFIIDGLSALTDLYAVDLSVKIWPYPDTVCLGSSLQLISLVEGGSGFYTYSWTSSPAGFTSDNPTPSDSPEVTTTYFLEVSTYNQVADDDTMVVVVQKPWIDAGSNGTICEGLPYSLSDATGSSFSQVVWTTSGDGGFFNASELNTTYYPGISDIMNGSAILILTAFPLSSCCPPILDSMILTILPMPVKPARISASRTTVCQGETDSIIMEAIGGAGDTLFWYTGICGGIPSDTGLRITIFPPDTSTRYFACWRNTCGSSDCAIATIKVLPPGCHYQLINFSSGWGSVSSFLYPVNDSIEEMFAPVTEDLVILQNMNLVYWPSQGINTIGFWDTLSGYKINMTRDTQLIITGTILTDKTLDLPGGWTILPVLSSTGVPSAGLLDTMNSLIIVKEIAGNNIYWPQEGIYTLDTLQTGKAYMINVSGPCSIVFP
jgi:hypothetical protein